MTEFCSNCGTLLRSEGKGKYCPRCRKEDSGKTAFSRMEGDGSLSTDDDYFPFENIRKGQKEFKKDAEAVFDEKRTLIAHAPTGIGKTAAVLPAAVKAKKEGQKIFFLTSKQSQHHIAVETIKKMPSSVNATDVISKKHMCPREESRLPYPVFEEFCSEKGQTECNLFNKKMSQVVEKLRERTKHVSEIIDICRSSNVCPHKAALVAGKDSELIVCDYNYIFSDIQERIFDLLEIELEDVLLIVDEAHNLPSRIRGNLEEKLSIPLLEDAFTILQGYSSSIGSFMSRLSSELRGGIDEERRIEKTFLDEKIDRALKGGLSQFSSLEDLMGDLEVVAREILEQDASATAPMHVYSFLDKWKIEGKEVFRSVKTDPPTVEVGLLDPAKYSEEVFRKIDSAVLMSGTLHPGKMYSDILGIEDSKAKIETYGSPFPDENRKIVSLEHLTTAYKERDLNMYQAYANSIADVANKTPGNVAVFFPSYALMNHVTDRLKMVHMEKDMMIEEREHSKKEKKELVDQLKRNDNNVLLGVQGGSLSEGIDYRDNILSSVIIAGIPFPPPSLRLEALEEYYKEKFGKEKGYNYSRIYPAMNRVLQAAGRPIRSKTDRALIVLMDKRFNYDRYKKRLPDDFEYSPESDLTEVCRNFFDR
ncbi:MAG: ATP-dependent DNA helicase [Candidatus Thermoplasmatota archaeon]|nr:ATP-dependent DNA helicase [Candidatus Thermoplasmatota archaeon]